MMMSRNDCLPRTLKRLNKKDTDAALQYEFYRQINHLSIMKLENETDKMNYSSWLTRLDSDNSDLKLHLIKILFISMRSDRSFYLFLSPPPDNLDELELNSKDTTTMFIVEYLQKLQNIDRETVPNDDDKQAAKHHRTAAVATNMRSYTTVKTSQYYVQTFYVRSDFPIYTWFNPTFIEVPTSFDHNEWELYLNRFQIKSRNKEFTNKHRNSCDDIMKLDQVTKEIANQFNWHPHSILTNEINRPRRTAGSITIDMQIANQPCNQPQIDDAAFAIVFCKVFPGFKILSPTMYSTTLKQDPKFVRKMTGVRLIDYSSLIKLKKDEPQPNACVLKQLAPVCKKGCAQKDNKCARPTISAICGEPMPVCCPAVILTQECCKPSSTISKFKNKCPDCANETKSSSNDKPNLCLEIQMDNSSSCPDKTPCPKKASCPDSSSCPPKKAPCPIYSPSPKNAPCPDIMLCPKAASCPKEASCPDNSSCPPKKAPCPDSSSCPPKKASCPDNSSCPPKKAPCPDSSSCPPKNSPYPDSSSCPPKKSPCPDIMLCPKAASCPKEASCPDNSSCPKKSSCPKTAPPCPKNAPCPNHSTGPNNPSSPNNLSPKCLKPKEAEKPKEREKCWKILDAGKSSMNDSSICDWTETSVGQSKESSCGGCKKPAKSACNSNTSHTTAQVGRVETENRNPSRNSSNAQQTAACSACPRNVRKSQELVLPEPPRNVSRRETLAPPTGVQGRAADACCPRAKVADGAADRRPSTPCARSSGELGGRRPEDPQNRSCPAALPAQQPPTRRDAPRPCPDRGSVSGAGRWDPEVSTYSGFAESRHGSSRLTTSERRPDARVPAYNDGDDDDDGDLTDGSFVSNVRPPRQADDCGSTGSLTSETSSIELRMAEVSARRANSRNGEDRDAGRYDSRARDSDRFPFDGERDFGRTLNDITESRVRHIDDVSMQDTGGSFWELDDAVSFGGPPPTPVDLIMDDAILSDRRSMSSVASRRSSGRGRAVEDAPSCLLEGNNSSTSGRPNTSMSSRNSRRSR